MYMHRNIATDNNEKQKHILSKRKPDPGIFGRIQESLYKGARHITFSKLYLRLQSGIWGQSQSPSERF